MDANAQPETNYVSWKLFLLIVMPLYGLFTILAGALLVRCCCRCCRCSDYGDVSGVADNSVDGHPRRPRASRQSLYELARRHSSLLLNRLNQRRNGSGARGQRQENHPNSNIITTTASGSNFYEIADGFTNKPCFSLEASPPERKLQQSRGDKMDWTPQGGASRDHACSPQSLELGCTAEMSCTNIQGYTSMHTPACNRRRGAQAQTTAPQQRYEQLIVKTGSSKMTLKPQNSCYSRPMQPLPPNPPATTPSLPRKLAPPPAPSTPSLSRKPPPPPSAQATRKVLLPSKPMEEDDEDEMYTNLEACGGCEGGEGARSHHKASVTVSLTTMCSQSSDNSTHSYVNTRLPFT